MNIVGKIGLCICACLNISVVAVPLELKIQSIEGVPLEQVGVGVPFLVDVTASGRDTRQKPEIAGLETFDVNQTGMRVFTINGDTSITFTYKVRIDKPGTYTIGPATMVLNGRPVQSKSIQINVGAEQLIDKDYMKKQQAEIQEAFLKLSVDNEKVYVGQRLMVTLSFYGRPDETKLERIEEPSLTAFTVGTREGPVTSSEVVNGKSYTVLTWHWDLYPKQAGTLVIPASWADFESVAEAHDQLSFFSPFFRFRSEHKRIYSNAVTLHVKALPAFKGKVHAIGEFKDISAQINPSTAKEGEGMVLLIEVEGDGNLAAIDTLQLDNMPEQIKWYDSKQYVRDTPGIHGMPVKCFEYIVQGLKHGTWEIPSQQFTYFDAKQGSYKTLKTEPLKVTIKDNGGTVVSVKAETQQEKSLESKEACLPLNTWSSLRPVHQRSGLPWWLFFMIAAIPVAWTVWLLIRIIILHQADFFKQKYAFKIARKQIKQAASHRRTQDLHKIFIDLFAQRLQCAPSLISQEIIEQTFMRAGLPEEQMRAWDQFYTRVYEQAFSATYYDEQQKKDLMQQAFAWVTKLEKIL